MRLLTTHIRGAIGFNYDEHSIQQEEVYVDFTKFQPGLIALIGANGTGKTTFLELLHPYLMLASRDQKIQDQFELKNSYRINRYLMNDKIYICKLLVDGLTGAAEAYIYEGNEQNPLNDGKLTTYREQVSHIFGTPETFFNSRFSGQTPANISSLKFAQRRALFYEVLNILKYEALQKSASTRRSKEEQKLATIDGELNTLLAEVNSIAYTKPMIAEKIYEKQEKQRMIDIAKISLENLQILLDDVKKSVILLETRKNEMQSIKTDLDGVILSINQHNYSIEVSIAQLKSDRESEVKKYETDNTHQAEIKRLESEKKVAEEKYELEKQQIYESIETVKKDILDCNAVIDAEKVKLERIKRIQNNKKTIDDNLARKKTVTEEINRLMLSDGNLATELSLTKEAKNLRLQKVTEIQNKVNLQENEIKQLKNLNEKDEKRIGELKQEKLDKIAEVENETAILKDVPCDEKLGATCPLISNTIDKKKKLDETLRLFDLDIESKLEETNIRLINIITLEKEISGSKIKVDTEKESIEIDFTPKVNDYKTRLEKIAEDIKNLTKELAEINKSDWEKLNTEYNEAEQTKKLAEQSIQNQEALVVEKEKSKANYDTNLNSASTAFAEKTTLINEQIESKNNLFTAEREAIINRYDTQIKNINDNSEKNLDELKKKKQELEKKYDADIETTYSNELEKQNKCQADEKEAIEAIERMNKELSDIEAEIKTMEDALVKKKLNEDKIAEKNAGKLFVSKEITEYSLIEKAFSKTGIPVLKLENSGPQITNIANEILSIFDNRFRIKFDTLEPTADGKSLKEVFNINIVDARGAVDIGLKSGGQKAWLNEALRQAIGIFNSHQGKKIETLFIDEKDDGLDESNALQYLQMLKQIHKLSSTHHSIVISHKPEAKELITQKIIFTPGEPLKIVTEEL